MDQAVRVRQGEHEAGGLARDRHGERGGRVAERGRGQHDVHALAGPQGDLRGEPAGPGTGRVDHPPGAHLQAGAGQLVAQRAVRRQGADPGQDPDAVRRRGAGEGHHQARVVLELAVPAEQAAAQPVAAHRRDQPLHLDGAHPARAGQDAARRAGGPAQPVAGPVGRSDQQLLPAGRPGAQGHDHRQRPDQVRSGAAQEHVALAGGLEGQADVAGGQVAQPAVHELARPAAGAVGEVVLLDQGDR